MYSGHKYCRLALVVFPLTMLVCVSGNTVAQNAPLESAPPIQRVVPAPPTENAHNAHANQGPISSAENPRERLQIGTGDLLEISVYGSDFQKLVRVASKGDIALPLIGSVEVGGLTTKQAESKLRKLLVDGGYFNDPEVSVFTKEYATQGISILGEVQKPGVYPVLGSRRLLDAISLAGGTTVKAGKFVSIMHRQSPEQVITVELFNGPTPAMQNNVEVYPGDTIEVSTAPIIYVVGDVRLPGAFVVDNGKHMTVLQAIAMAQGTNPTAALNRTKVIRQTGDGPRELPVPLKNILSARASDLPLQADDIVFVPSSIGKSAARRGLEGILQTATGLAIYRH